MRYGRSAHRSSQQCYWLQRSRRSPSLHCRLTSCRNLPALRHVPDVTGWRHRSVRRLSNRRQDRRRHLLRADRQRQRATKRRLLDCHSSRRGASSAVLYSYRSLSLSLIFITILFCLKIVAWWHQNLKPRSSWFGSRWLSTTSGFYLDGGVSCLRTGKSSRYRPLS